MNKSISLMILGLMVVSMIGAVSAAPVSPNERVLVSGKIYNADFTQIVPGANVTITCIHSEVPYLKETVSDDEGQYSGIFIEGVECDNGDSLTVSAVKGSLYGSMTGTIYNDVFSDPDYGNWDLAVVNVPLVPEFGLIVGMVTILGAIGVFFVVRRK